MKYRIIYDVLRLNGKRRQKRETLEGVSKNKLRRFSLNAGPQS